MHTVKQGKQAKLLQLQFKVSSVSNICFVQWHTSFIPFDHLVPFKCFAMEFLAEQHQYSCIHKFPKIRNL